MKANSNLKPFLKRILLMLAIALTLTGIPSLESGDHFLFSTVTVEAATKLTAPTISSITNASTGVKLKWKKSSKATGYYVYRKTSSGSWKKIKTIKKNTMVSYTDTTAKNGTTYSYKVTAYSGKTTKSSSTKKITRVDVPTMSSLVSKSCVSLTAKVTSTKKMSGYQIQYSTSKSFGSSAVTVKLSSGTSASKTVKALKSGKKYYVRARAYKTVSGKKYYPAWSSAKAVKISSTHSYSLTKTVAATCTSDGYKQYTCSVCGSSYKNTLTATGHTAGSWVTTKAATCTAAGTKVKKCATCGTVLETATIAATGHTSGDWTVTKAATCTEAGTKVKTCTTCGEVISTASIAATGHSYTSEVTKETTCAEPGIRTYTCSVCGDSYTETIAATGDHDYQVTDSKAATCAEDGYTTYTCSTCGDIYTVTVSATGTHNYQVIGSESATCSETGYTTYTCSVCGDSYTETIAATGEHTYEVDDSEEATCTEDGYITYVCSECGDSYTETLAATGDHDYQVTSNTDVTYYTSGSTVYTCTKCGDSYTVTTEVTGKATAQAAYQAAKEALESAQAAYDEAEAAWNEAEEKLESAQAAEDTAEAELAEKQAAVTAATTALAEAQAALDAAQEAYDSSDTATQIAAAEANLANAEEALEEAEEKQTLGSYAFFEWLECESAMEILETAYDGIERLSLSPKPEYTNIGTTGDATSLENLMNTVQYLVECNELRSMNDLSEFKIVPELMAMAECNANASLTLLDHSDQFNAGENLALLSSAADPYDYWYYEEKENAETENGGTTGHYATIISESYTLTGLGICTKGTRYKYVYSQTFLSEQSIEYYAEAYPDCIWGDGEGNAVYTAYTVEEFSNLLDEYYAEVVTKPEAAVAEAEAALEAAKAATENSDEASALTAAQEAVAEAQAVLDKANEELTDAQTALTAAQNAVSEAEAEEDAAGTAYTKAETALEEADDAYLKAAEELEKFD